MVAPATQSSKEEVALRLFLADRKVLIADPSASSRSGLFKVLHDSGAPTSNLILVNTFEAAREAITQSKPHVVIVEFDLGKRCGLELLQTQREQRPIETRECIFVVVTCNTSQTAVARAAEEDVDAYILKPYTIDSVRKMILQAVIRKLQPSEYYLAIEEGKRLLGEKNLDDAEQQFERAVSLDPAPALAFYYQGQVSLMRQVLDESKGKYEKGLECNRIHYKCMVGLFDLLLQQKNHLEAYHIVKKISQYFPANPKRLTEVLRLAVMTSQFEDIEKYYNTFVNIDERDETLVRYVCAALVVCGKHYLNSKASSRALELFRKAAATGQGRVRILREIVLALVGHSMTKECHFFMERFPPDSQGSDDFMLLRFLVADAEGQVSLVINQGRELIKKGVSDERLFAIMLRRGKEAHLTPMAIEDIVTRATSTFPEKKAYFEGIAGKSGQGA